MEINEENKKIYEASFTGWERWLPLIDESNIEDDTQDEEGNWIPATPVGCRDYMEARKEGIKNIIDNVPSIEMTRDQLYETDIHNLPFKFYDHIFISDRDKHVVVFYNDIYDNRVYFEDAEGKKSYVNCLLTKNIKEE